MQTTTVILADGKFPEHPVPLEILRKAGRIVFCDGAAVHIDRLGLNPHAIVGDCDSIPPLLGKKYSDKIYRTDEQETNDLTKAVMWCKKRNYENIIILGATGNREDHTVGNISLLLEYGRLLKVKTVTDFGVIIPVFESDEFDSFAGQRISLFSVNNETEITSEGLKYPLVKRKLTNWWQATLNQSTGNLIKLILSHGPVLLFMGFGDEAWDKAQT